MFELFAYVVSALVSAAGAAALSTAAMTAAYYAFSTVVIGYSISRSRRRAAQARRDGTQDRLVTVRSADAPREIVYGRVRKGGVLIYGVSATATQPYFVQMFALAGHECDGLEAVFVGETRYGWDPVSGRLVSPDPNTPLRYARVDRVDTQVEYQVDGSRQINVGQGMTVLGISGIARQDELDNPVWVSYGFAQQTNGTGTPTGTVTIPEATPGMRVVVVQRESTPRSWIRVKWLSGSIDQQADEELIRLSGGEWTVDHRARGRCCAIVIIDSDPEVFSDGLPEFTFVIRGKRVRLWNNTVGWSRNSAECLRDYLTTYVRWPDAAVTEAEFQESATACALTIARDDSTTIARYTCDGVLVQDETLHREHVQALLSAMMGTLVPVGDKAAMLAGIYRTPAITLTDDDLIGPASVSAFQPQDSAFNAVRGRYFDGEESPGVPANRTFQRINFPPYTSSTYVAQDGGRVDFDDVELPMTVDPVRVQYMAKLHLHRSRQALRFTATWGIKALGLQVGRTCRLPLTRYGWNTLEGGLGKTFRVEEMRIDLSKMQVTATMQEEAPSIYSATYTEFDGTDPAPNTGFPTFREIAPPAGLKVESGSSYVRLRGDGTRAPFARVTWDAIKEPSVLSGGWIDLEWITNNAGEWQRAARLDPYTTAFHIETVVASDLLRVRVRACNLIAKSPWTYSVTTINASAGPGTSAVGLGIGVNAVQGARMASLADLVQFQYWDLTIQRFTDPPDIANTIFYNSSGSRVSVNSFRMSPAGYGLVSIIEELYSTGLPTRRGVFISKTQFPVVPGDIWETQAFVSGSRAAYAEPGLLYYNAQDQLVAGSIDDDKLPIIALQRGVTPRVGGITSLVAQLHRRYAFVKVPPGVTHARWCYFFITDAAFAVQQNLVVSMPFAAKCLLPSEAALRANPDLYLTNWNG